MGVLCFWEEKKKKIGQIRKERETKAMQKLEQEAKAAEQEMQELKKKAKLQKTIDDVKKFKQKTRKPSKFEKAIVGVGDSLSKSFSPDLDTSTNYLKPKKSKRLFEDLKW